jgi:FkbM family methyltransferase
MIKAAVRTVLNKVVSRHRFNDSPLYLAYTRLFLPDAARSKHLEEVFYRSLLEERSNGLIFDVGANAGAKTAIFSKIANKVISVEANPTAARVLKQRFHKNKRVHVVEKACGACDETRLMYFFKDADAYNTLSEKWRDALANGPDGAVGRPPLVSNIATGVSVTTLDKLINVYGLPSYIKIDVEGFELEVIKGLSRRVPMLSFECNLPVFKAETLKIINLLSELAPSGLYNFTVTEPPFKFEEREWISNAKISQMVAAQRFAFMEIYFNVQN